MNEFKRRLILLHHCRGASWKIIYKLLKTDPELHSLYELDLIQHHPIYNSLQTSQTSSLTNLLRDLHSTTIHDQIQQYALNNIQAITFFDDEYPKELKETFEPPWVLYVKGDSSLLKKERKLAIVGSRQASEYGKNALKKLVPELVAKEMVIVSGLAKGIDALAHEVTLASNGKTIAVIAGGFFHLYPQETIRLAKRMMQEQLILSEYPPNTKPTRWQFPMRNRIISGLSLGTLIIEAKRRSGSLITANYALQEGREVFAIPGSIFSPYSVGTNELIQQGAKLVMGINDIMEELHLSHINGQ